MNIFVLAKNPWQAARFHCDKHVVKMPLETAQMLCTAHHSLAGLGVQPVGAGVQFQAVYSHEVPVPAALYKATHVGHPCSIWVRKTKANYEWTYELFCALAAEYERRYCREHLSWTKLGEILKCPPRGIPVGDGLTPFAQAMPDIYKHPNAVTAYRQYYNNEKRHLFQYTKTPLPRWLSC